PKAEEGAEPRLVTSPAHEALRMMRSAEPESTGSPRVPEQAGRSAATSARADGTERAGEQRREDGHRSTGRHLVGTVPALPVPHDALAPGTDLCGLGEQYGGWAPDSPQENICRDAYGS
ncbi:hypothetical protein, partial [Streptomyces boluensis]